MTPEQVWAKYRHKIRRYAERAAGAAHARLKKLKGNDVEEDVAWPIELAMRDLLHEAIKTEKSK